MRVTSASRRDDNFWARDPAGASAFWGFMDKNATFLGVVATGGREGAGEGVILAGFGNWDIFCAWTGTALFRTIPSKSVAENVGLAAETWSTTLVKELYASRDFGEGKKCGNLSNT